MSEVGGSEDHFGGPIVPNQQPKPRGPLIRHPQSELRALPVWAKELIAGGAAGGLAKTCVAPLERVKILYQTGQMHGQSVWSTVRAIVQTEGIEGLFKGNGASVLRIMPYAAIHYGAYEHYRAALLSAADRVGATQWLTSPATAHHAVRVSPVVDLLAGSGAGATAVLVTYPLDLVRTRLAYQTSAIAAVEQGQPASSGAGSDRQAPGNAAAQRQAAGREAGRAARRSAHSVHRSSITGVMREVVQQEGFWGLYRGIGPTLAGILPYAGLKFYVYQSLKQYYAEYQEQHGAELKAGDRLPTPVMLSAGATAGLVAQTVTYPLDVVRRRMQVQGLKLSAAQQRHMQARQDVVLTSTWQGMKLIAQREGVRALYAGLSINYFKVVPSTAIGFTIYDKLKSYLGLVNHL